MIRFRGHSPSVRTSTLLVDCDGRDARSDRQTVSSLTLASVADIAALEATTAVLPATDN